MKRIHLFTKVLLVVLILTNSNAFAQAPDNATATKSTADSTTTLNRLRTNNLLMPITDNIYTVDGTIASDRWVNLNNNVIVFQGAGTGGNMNAFSFSPRGNESGAGFHFSVLSRKNYLQANLAGDGISSIQLHSGRMRYNLTKGFNSNGAWLQSASWDGSNSTPINQAFSLLLNPLGGNIGVGLGATTTPTAQLHTKGTVRFEEIASSTTNTQLLSVDTAGNVFKQDVASLNVPNNLNIYNSSGLLTAQRMIALNEKTLTVGGMWTRSIFNPDPFNSSHSAALDVMSHNIPIDPNLKGIGLFKIVQEKSERYLTQGVNAKGTWIQSSVNLDNNADSFPLSINPLYGNVGIGIAEPTAQLHTIKSVRFEGLPFVVRPVGILGTDSQGNVFNVDPSSLGEGSGVNIYNSNGFLTNNRILDLNGKNLSFSGNIFSQVYNTNNNAVFCPTGASGESFSTINGNHSDFIPIGERSSFMLPDYNIGYFKLKATQGGRGGSNGNQLNFGVGSDNSWMQSSTHYITNRDGYCGNDNSKLYLNPLGGKVSIGTTNIDCVDCDEYRLFVLKGIRTEKVRVDIASVKNWADYVFDKEYKLMPLNDLKQFIAINGHLPSIPKAEDVVRDGLDLGAMDAKLLEKIEELTLYTIALNSKNEELEKTKLEQDKLIQNLADRLEKLEKQ